MDNDFMNFNNDNLDNKANLSNEASLDTNDNLRAKNPINAINDLTNTLNSKEEAISTEATSSEKRYRTLRDALNKESLPKPEPAINKENSEFEFKPYYSEATAKEATISNPIPNKCYSEDIKKPKRHKSFGRLIASLLIVSIFGGGSIGAGYGAIKYLYFNNQPISQNGNSLTTTTPNAIGVSSSNSNSAVTVIDNVFPSVVNISTSGVTNEEFWGYVMPHEYENAGSGILFSQDETKVYIATNEHVVAGANTISISINGDDIVEATRVGDDSSSDLAVISVLKSDLQEAGINNITIAKFGDSDNIHVGEYVVAIGNALGEGKVATGGMISSKLKNVNIDGNNYTVIQTDSAINPGNSGGALVNYNGEIIGINTAKSSSSQIEGMGYAIPSNIALPILNTLLENGSIPKPYIGIMGRNITDELAQTYGLPVGVYVSQVLENSGAKKAGIREGDIITDLNGVKIMNMDKLIETVSKIEIGETVSIRIIRDGREVIETTIQVLDANNL